MTYMTYRCVLARIWRYRGNDTICIAILKHNQVTKIRTEGSTVVIEREEINGMNICMLNFNKNFDSAVEYRSQNLIFVY